jgi:hypothetical protein
MFDLYLLTENEVGEKDRLQHKVKGIICHLGISVCYLGMKGEVNPYGKLKT